MNSRSRRKLAALAILAAVLATTAAVTYAYSNSDDLQLLFSNWLSGKPKAMVKLIVNTPSAPQISYCYVAVRRLPTPMEPTSSGYSELIYFGRVPGGATVVVRHVFNAVPVYFNVTRSGGERLGYYEPKEYVVTVTCVGRDGKPLPQYTYTKFINVFPKKLISVVPIRPPKAAPPNLRSRGEGVVGGGSSYAYESTCKIRITKVGRDAEGVYKLGYCNAWVALTYVNSVPGISTTVEFNKYPPTAVYLTAFARHDGIASTGSWEPAGELPAESLIAPTGGVKPYASDGGRRLILVEVRFAYEYHEVGGPGGRVAVTELLYPTCIGAAASIPAGRYVEPAAHPPYAFRMGQSTSISLGVKGAVVSGKVTGVKTLLKVSALGGPGFLKAVVSVYRAVRSDREYAPLYFLVIDKGGVPYWWWFRGDDPTTYEVMLKRA